MEAGEGPSSAKRVEEQRRQPSPGALSADDGIRSKSEGAERSGAQAGVELGRKGGHYKLKEVS